MLDADPSSMDQRVSEPLIALAAAGSVMSTCTSGDGSCSGRIARIAIDGGAGAVAVAELEAGADAATATLGQIAGFSAAAHAVIVIAPHATSPRIDRVLTRQNV
jgi:hypothetical protein